MLINWLPVEISDNDLHLLVLVLIQESIENIINETYFLLAAVVTQFSSLWQSYLLIYSADNDQIFKNHKIIPNI